MDSSASFEIVSYAAMTLMCLDDDCLLTIFELLSVLDLSIIAGVCTRFRSIAKRRFSLSKNIVVHLPPIDYGRHYDFPIDEMVKSKILKETLRILRNFGSSITEIELKPIPSGDRFKDKFVGLLYKYCSGVVTGLTAEDFHLNHVTNEMGPLVSSLRRFRCGSRWPIAILHSLTKVEDLQLDAVNVARCVLQCSFKHLRRISMNPVHIDCGDFAMFLKNSKMLKEVVLKETKISRTAGQKDFFDTGSSHIEKLDLHLSYDCDCLLNVMEVNCFRNLTNLNSLALRASMVRPTSNRETIAIIRAIVGAEIPLKHLTLQSSALFKNGAESRRLCVALRSVHLETLNLETPFYTDVNSITRMHAQLECLTHLKLEIWAREMVLSIDDLMTLVRCYQNLQQLMVRPLGIRVALDREDFTIFDSSFENFVEILMQRPIEMPLRIELWNLYNVKVSNDLAERHRHILAIIEHTIPDIRIEFLYIHEQ